MGRRRHKKRTHLLHQEANQSDDAPKSMVLKMGDHKRRPTHALGQLVHDFRQMMQPHTASRLKERRTNKLKDFLVMAGPLGVSHFFIFSQSSSGNTTLRLAKTPRGPTLYFRVESFSLCADIQRSQAQPHALSPSELQQAPVLVMNNFKADKTSDREALITSMFHNMLPSTDVDSTPLSSVKRVILLDRDQENDLVYLRHYAIITRTVGSSRAVKKLAQARAGQRSLPSLGKFADVTEFMIDPSLSESEAEEDVLPQQHHQQAKRAVKLVEVGPRLTLRHTKIEDGMCSGRTLWHFVEKRSEKDSEQLEQKHRQHDALRNKRRSEQEENVRRKREELAAKGSRSKRGRERAQLRESEARSETLRDEDVSDAEQAPEDMNDFELDAEIAKADEEASSSS